MQISYLSSISNLFNSGGGGILHRHHLEFVKSETFAESNKQTKNYCFLSSESYPLSV